MALTKLKYGDNEADILKGGSEEDANLIEFCLKTKGFCCISEAVDHANVEKAREEVDTMAGNGDFQVPNTLVQDGLLGVDGSAHIADMQMTNFEEGAADPEHPELHKIDLLMWSLSKSVIAAQDSLGFEATSRSCGFVHQSGDSGEEMELTDLEADKWSSIFLRRKVAILVFLGPDTGTLELQPYDEEANPSEIPTYPGLAVLLRTDQLAFKYESMGTGCCVSSFIMQDSILRMDKEVREVHVTPPAAAIEKWIAQRLLEMKATEDAETVWGDETPRGFVLAMNHSCTKLSHTIIPGLSVRCPTTHHWDLLYRSTLSGLDPVIEVPRNRWDHDQSYDPSPTCWQQPIPKTNCRHGSFVDGLEFFDNKMFGLAPVEARGMDPTQRLLLECTYDSLFQSGMRKSKMVNSSTGVYLAIAGSEWDMIEKDDQGSFGATGGHPAIACGRISFCLGLKGASTSIDTECCAALTALSNAAESVQLKGRGRVQETACGCSGSIQLARAWWPAMSAAGLLSAVGRCLTFDQSADGYMRADCVGVIAVRRQQDIVDGEIIEEKENFGMIYGSGVVHNGQTASLFAPNSMAIQECLRDGVRHADIQPYDVDAVECHGDGNYLSDAVECASHNKSLRDANTHEMLALLCGKTNVGNGKETAGTFQVIRTLMAARLGVMAASQHLIQLNPHIDLQESSLNLLTEPLAYRLKSNFQACFSRGMGGTNTCMLFHGAVSEELRPPPKPCPEELRPKLTYWIGGGGSLEGKSYGRAYYITGSFNGWSTDQPMQEEEDGCYSATVVLGENRWEQFRIIIDGDTDRTLHPNRYKAPKGTMVFGPEEVDPESSETSWLIDGRTQFTTFESGGSAGYDFVEYSSADQGVAGTQYRISLYMSGKWRTVSWSKLESDLALESVEKGKYYLLGDWDFFDMSKAIELEADASKPGVFTTTVQKRRSEGRFLIVRNKDTSQMIYPLAVDAGMEAPVVGPDDMLYDTSWLLPDTRAVKITLTIASEDMKDVKKVTWESA